MFSLGGPWSARSKKAATKNSRGRATEAEAESLRFYQERVLNLPSRTSFSLVEVAEMARDYLQRYDGEIEQLVEQREKGFHKKPKTLREDHLVFAKDALVSEFTGPGLEVPDLTLSKVVKRLRDWSWDTGTLADIPKMRIKASILGPRWAENGKTKRLKLLREKGEMVAESAESIQAALEEARQATEANTTTKE